MPYILRTFDRVLRTEVKYWYSASRDLKFAPLYHNYNVPPKHEKRQVYSPSSKDGFSLEIKFLVSIAKVMTC
jgi:hypothetical protein